METLDVGLNVLLYFEMAMSFGEHEVEGYGLNLESPPTGSCFKYIFPSW